MEHYKDGEVLEQVNLARRLTVSESSGSQEFPQAGTQSILQFYLGTID